MVTIFRRIGGTQPGIARVRPLACRKLPYAVKIHFVARYVARADLGKAGKPDFVVFPVGITFFVLVFVIVGRFIGTFGRSVVRVVGPAVVRPVGVFGIISAYVLRIAFVSLPGNFGRGGYIVVEIAGIIAARNKVHKLVVVRVLCNYGSVGLERTAVVCAVVVCVKRRGTAVAHREGTHCASAVHIARHRTGRVGRIRAPARKGIRFRLRSRSARRGKVQR